MLDEFCSSIPLVDFSTRYPQFSTSSLRFIYFASKKDDPKYDHYSKFKDAFFNLGKRVFIKPKIFFALLEE